MFRILSSRSVAFGLAFMGALLVTAYRCESLTLAAAALDLPLAATATVFCVHANPLCKWQRWVDNNLGPVLQAAEEYCLILAGPRAHSAALSDSRQTLMEALTERAECFARLERPDPWQPILRIGLYFGSLAATGCGVTAMLTMFFCLSDRSPITAGSRPTHSDSAGLVLLSFATAVCAFSAGYWLSENAYAGWAADLERRRLLRAAKLFERLVRHQSTPDITFNASHTVRIIFRMLPCRYLKRR